MCEEPSPLPQGEFEEDSCHLWCNFCSKNWILHTEIMANNAALLESGSKLDWTHDNKLYEWFQDGKQEIELILSISLLKAALQIRNSCLRLWIEKESFPLLKRWTAQGKLELTREETWDSSARIEVSSGFLLQTHFRLLEEEFKPKSNKFYHPAVDTNQAREFASEWMRTGELRITFLCIEWSTPTMRIFQPLLKFGKWKK